MDFNKWILFWATCFGLMDFLVIVGKSPTIATLLKKNFRKGSHFLSISLAVADLLVGCTIPMYMAALVVRWHKPEIIIYALYLALCPSITSIFHWPVISLERLHAILRPFRHRQLSLTAYWFAIPIPCIVSLSFTIPAFMPRASLKRSHLVFFVIVFLTTPLVITCFSYTVIWKKGRESHNKVRSFRQNQEARCSKIIFLVTVASSLTRMPFQLCNIVLSLSPTMFMPLSVFFSIRLHLQFSNSFLNFVVYFLRFPSYRKALFSMFSCPKSPNHQTITTPVPSSGEPRSSQVFKF